MKSLLILALIAIGPTSTFAATQCSQVMVSLEEKIQAKAQPFLDQGYYLMQVEPSAVQGYYVFDFYHPFKGEQGRGKNFRQRIFIP